MSTIIRQIRLGDQQAFLAAVMRSKALHKPWVSPAETPEAFQSYVNGLVRPNNFGFLIEVSAGEEVFAGAINLTNIVYGKFLSGYLGYYAFAGYERQGYMRWGLKAVAKYAFKELKLHRLEANIQPENTASINLVRSCGFEREGFSPKYLKINGRWRDHERWALLANY